MAREAALFTRVHRITAVPRPAAKAGPLVVSKSLVNFSLGVHDKRAVLGHGLANWTSLQDQQLGGLVTVVQHAVIARPHFDERAAAYRFTGHLQAVARKVVQLAARALAQGRRQGPLRARFQANGVDAQVAFRRAGPGVWRGRQRLLAGQMACDTNDFGLVALRIDRVEMGNVFVPEHGEVRLGHLAARGQVKPNLEQFGGVGGITVQQRKHLAVHDAFAGREPLHVATAKAGRSAQRVRVVNAALAHDGDGLKATVRVRWKAGHGVAVVHAPTVFARKVLAYCPPGQRGLWRQICVASGVGIDVVDAEQKRVQRGPRGVAQRGDSNHGFHVHIVARSAVFCTGGDKGRCWRH
jgi:hypothetical protein